MCKRVNNAGYNTSTVGLMVGALAASWNFCPLDGSGVHRMEVLNGETGQREMVATTLWVSPKTGDTWARAKSPQGMVILDKKFRATAGQSSLQVAKSWVEDGVNREYGPSHGAAAMAQFADQCLAKMDPKAMKLDPKAMMEQAFGTESCDTIGEDSGDTIPVLAARCLALAGK